MDNQFVIYPNNEILISNKNQGTVITLKIHEQIRKYSCCVKEATQRSTYCVVLFLIYVRKYKLISYTRQFGGFLWIREGERSG